MHFFCKASSKKLGIVGSDNGMAIVLGQAITWKNNWHDKQAMLVDIFAGWGWMGKDNCKTRQELILEVWQSSYIASKHAGYMKIESNIKIHKWIL